MSNNRNLSTPMNEEALALFSLYFEEDYNQTTHVGSLIIKGLELPQNSSFSPLGKIWSSVRKRIAEEYDIQVTGTFHRVEHGEIIGTFIANMASVDENKTGIMLSRFKDTFQIMMCKFESVIESWIMNDNGLAAYKAYCSQHEHPNLEHCDAMFDDFLMSIGVKTEKDIKEREKKKHKLKRHNIFDLFSRFSLDPIEDD